MKTTYPVKLRVKLGLTRAAKAMIAAFVIALLGFLVEWFTQNQNIFGDKNVIWVGLGIAVLLGLQKALEKAK
jgi:hypothetical protein